jgi:hypothetical protein
MPRAKCIPRRSVNKTLILNIKLGAKQNRLLRFARNDVAGRGMLDKESPVASNRANQETPAASVFSR